jgi:uncharacterized membrane protein
MTEHLGHEIFEHVSLPARLIWVHIALHGEGEYTYADMVKLLWLSDATVYKAFKSLKENGLIEVVTQGGGEAGRVASEYRAVFPK